MEAFTLDFEKGSDIWGLYQALKKEGTKDSDLDQGYYDYDKDFKNHRRNVIQKNDKVIQKEEVLGYALERHEKFQLAIKEKMGYEVPWALDDLDPETTLDQEIREKANKAISFFKNRLEKAGYKPEEDKYQELLAASLFVFVMAVKKYLIPEEFKGKLEAAKLGEVVEYIKKEGSLSLLLIKNDCELTSSALAALMSKPKCGHCVEQSLVLYAVFKIAGLNVSFVDVKIPPNSDLLKRLGFPPGTYHSSVALILSNQIRIFDPGLKESDAEELYKEHLVQWKLLNSREFFSVSQSNLGAKFQVKGMLDKAIDEYKEAIKINPKNTSAHYNLGNAYCEKEEFAKAVEEYKKALEINPGLSKARHNLTSAHVNLGITYDRKGRFDKAIEEYKKALEIEPNLADALYNLTTSHLNLGTIYTQKGTLDKAIQEFRKALEINPNFFEARHNLGNTLAMQGTNLINKVGAIEAGWNKLKEAKIELETALKLNPDSARTLELIKFIENTQKILRSQYPDLK